MSTALRPVLRPTHLPSLPNTSSSTSRAQPTTYICQSCRHARVLRRPKRPYTFTQLVTLSDGSAFTMRTTSPYPVYRSTRDTRNAPLWNPSSRELTNVEDDEAGRLASFRARYGRMFDASQGAADAADEEEKEIFSTAPPAEGLSNIGSEGLTSAAGAQLFESPPKKAKAPKAPKKESDDGWDFGEDDASMLDLISSYGQENIKVQDPVKKPKKK